METIPLYSKVFCIDSLDIDDEYFNDVRQAVKNCDYKKADFEVDNSSLVNQEFEILNNESLSVKLKGIFIESFAFRNPIYSCFNGSSLVQEAIEINKYKKIINLCMS